MSNRSEIIAFAKALVDTTGRLVLLGETPMLGPDDPETAIAMGLGDDEPIWQGEQVAIRLPLHLYALAKADLDDPWIAVEALLGEIKAAVEIADRRWGKRLRAPLGRGLTRTLVREPGSMTVGAVITYWITYAEVWGTP